MKLVDVLLREGIFSPGSVTELVYGISPWDGFTWSGVNPGGAAVLKDDTSRLGDCTWTRGYEDMYGISGGVPGDKDENEVSMSFAGDGCGSSSE